LRAASVPDAVEESNELKDELAQKQRKRKEDEEEEDALWRGAKPESAADLRRQFTHLYL
jgi:hypothetical protein